MELSGCEEVNHGRVLEPKQIPEFVRKMPLREARNLFLHAYLVDALEANDGRKARTAKAIGITPQQLRNLMRAHGIRVDMEVTTQVRTDGAAP